MTCASATNGRRGSFYIELMLVLAISAMACEVIGSLMVADRRYDDGPNDRGAIVDAACDQLRRDLSAGWTVTDGVLIANRRRWTAADGWLRRDTANLVPGAQMRCEQRDGRLAVIITPRRGPERRVEAP